MSNPTKAVIYCRVSSAKQVKKGDGLGSQETRCREYAKHKNLEVIQVFRDEGVSGGVIDRPAMKNMLNFVRQNKKEQLVIIIDDISRLARGMKAHVDLRLAIDDAGGKLESPSHEFGEDSDSILVENLLASVSQHFRQKNAEQVKYRMRARVMNGYWVFSPITGYKFESVPGHGKMLVPDEPVATIIKEAFEGFASGRFSSQSEVTRFLNSCPAFPKPKNGSVKSQFVHDLLGKSIYAGYIDVPKWDIYLQPGKHEPLISFETLQLIKKRMNEQAHAPARKDLDEDFPLRGFISCGCCGQAVTAGWSKGRNARYPYYLCHTKGCSDYRKSVRKDIIEGQFEELLQDLRPTQDLFFMAKEMFKDLWEDRLERSKADSGALKAEIKAVEQKIDRFLDFMVDTNEQNRIASYETKIRKLEEQKVALNENIQNCGQPLKTFDETFRTAFGFLSNPYQLWESDRLEDKRSVLKLVFAERLPYYRNEGFRTAALSLPFCLTGQLKGGNNELVGRLGVEPRTY